jgi:hypothetical protein
MISHFNDHAGQVGENDSRRGARRTSRFLPQCPIVPDAWNIQALNSVGEKTGAVRAPHAAKEYACERHLTRSTSDMLARTLPRLRRNH